MLRLFGVPSSSSVALAASVCGSEGPGVLRPSARSCSGWVLVATFPAFSFVRSFRRHLAGARVPVVVRRCPAGWAVSVPVYPPAAVALALSR